MARFTRIRIRRGTAPQTVWKMIQDRLLVDQSVEVVVMPETPTYYGFELHSWDGERRDGSNRPGADPNQDY